MATRWSTTDMPDLTGKVAVVTGGNAGLGLVTVRELAARGAQVVLTSRNPQRGRDALAGLGALRGAVEVMQLDLADLSSVRAFAQEVGARHTAIDLLVNNAGIMMVPPGTTTDGFERQFGTNHLGHFALTGLLLDRLLAAPGARVVTLSSLAHRGGRFDPNAPDAPGADYQKVQAYGTSKLANLLFTYELQRRLAARGLPVQALAAHPGLSGTGLADHLIGGRAERLLRPLYGLLTQSADQGALPTLRAAVDPSALGGQFYGPDRMGQQRGAPVVVTSTPASYDVGTAGLLWLQSENLTGVRYLSD